MEESWLERISNQTRVELNKNIVFESLSLRIRFHPIYLFYRTSSIFAQDPDCRPVQIHTHFIPGQIRDNSRKLRSSESRES